MRTPTQLLAQLTAVGMGSFALYTGYAGTFYPFIQRSVPVLLGVVLTFLTVRARRTTEVDASVPFYDWVLIALAVPAFGYVAYNSTYLANRWPMTITYALTNTETVLAILAFVLLLEAVRRIMGWMLVLLSVAALLYCWLGQYIPIAALSHRPFPFRDVLDYLYMTDSGIWGVALGVAATYIVLFVIFAAFAEKAGVAEFFLDFANSIAGHTQGGAAKVAIFGSGLAGSVTGSTVANIYTVGQFTIPLMKRTGYSASMAGAIETLASNGGQLMPPVLGAAAFIVAAYSGVPYTSIALACLIPAVIYYGGLLWSIHVEAHKSGLVGIPLKDKPQILDVLKRGGHLFTPILALVGFLAYGLSPMRAGMFTIVYTVAVSWLRRETRLGPREILDAIEQGARNAVLIVLICAAVGFIIGAFTLTGLGLNISSAIISWSGGNFFLILVFIGVACLVLGMGMNTVAAFILVSVVGVPTLTGQGVAPLTANMFVFYFALLSHITPPVCLGIYAAASIAGAGVWQTALRGMKMGVVAYVLPFLVVYTPALLLQGTPVQVALGTLVSTAGLFFIVTGVQGWFLRPQGLVPRCLWLLAGIVLIMPEPSLRLAGAATGTGLVAATLMLLLVQKRRLDSALEGAPQQDPCLLPVPRSQVRADSQGDER